MMRCKAIPLISMVFLLLAFSAAATPPRLINYQGILTDADGSPSSGTFDLRFSIYPSDMPGDLYFWTELHEDVVVSDGLFNVILGGLTPIPVGLFNTGGGEGERWIGIKVDGDPEITPRMRITSVPWALNADYAEYAASAGATSDGDWTVDGDDMHSAVPGDVGIGTVPLKGEPPADASQEAVARQAENAKLQVWSATPDNDGGIHAYLYAGDDLDDGRAAIYAHRDGDGNNPGDGFGFTENNSAIMGYDGSADDFAFGVAGFCEEQGASRNRGGVLGSDGDGATWAALGYLDGSYVWWGIYTPDDAYLGGDVWVDGNTTFEDAVTLLGSLQIPDGAAPGRILTSDANGYATWQAGTGGSDSDWIIVGSDMYASVSGNVGIGVTAPAHKLEIETAAGYAIYAKTYDAGSPTIRTRNYGVGSSAGLSSDEYAVYGQMSHGVGVKGLSDSLAVYGENYNGRFGYLGGGYGAYGEKPNDNYGYLGGTHGVYGQDIATGNSGSLGSDEFGVRGYTLDAIGVKGMCTSGVGVYGEATTSGDAVEGYNMNGNTRGKLGTTLYGVHGVHDNGNYGFLGGEDQGVFGWSLNGDGVYGSTTNGYAGRFNGDVAVHSGDLTVSNGRIVTPVIEITGGSDLSERFEIGAGARESAPEPGMLVSIDPERPGELVVSSSAYDKRVAGVISGAGGVATGMLMGQEGTRADGEHPVALTGRVYCWADASYGAIGPGDMLTTSEVSGHAMKASDPARSHGTIIGKAMSSLAEGRGLVLVLVNLQ
jgi:hypothetical protein